MSNSKIFFTFPFLITMQLVSFGQDFSSLVQMAWTNNQQLKAKHFELESATQSHLESKALYGPDVKFGVQYTLASGGRSISFPVGDLLNPVYSTLNQLTQSTAFPQVENVNTQFLPNNFYDARFRITQPIYYPDLAINKKLRAGIMEQKSLEIKAFKRMVSKDIMQAWFQYRSAEQAIQIFNSADSLLYEAKRSTQSLVKNGVALPTAMSRLENQSATLQAQQSEALANYKNAERYLRYLLGVNDGQKIPMIQELPEIPNQIIEGHKQREELLQLKQAAKLQQLSIEKEDNHYLPKIGAQLDAGSQDFDLGWKPYVLLGVNVEMNIYDSKKHSYRRQAAKADVMATEATFIQMEKKISLQENVAEENLNSSIFQASTFKARIKATKKNYDEVYIKYKEGSAGYLELIDAQTQYTQISIQYLLAQNNAWMKWAEYIYSAAIYPID